MIRTYLIDSENINDIWVELLHCLEDKDEILVFYTDKSAHMGYDRIIRLMEHKRGTVRWLRCFEGQNALDFQLVTELGSRISQEPKREYIIVSNDTGYDAVVRYWQQKEYRVRRMKGVECETLVGAEREIAETGVTEVDDAEKDAAENAVVEKNNVAAEKQPDKPGRRNGREAQAPGSQQRVQPGAQDAGVPQQEQSKVQDAGVPQRVQPEAQDAGLSQSGRSDVQAADSWRDELIRIFQETGSHAPKEDMAFLMELCKTVKLSNMSLMHNVLEYHFGQTAGNAIYHFIKENPGCRGELSAGYSNNKKHREKQYLALILKRNHIVPEEGDEEAILKILGGIPRKNLNSIHTALVKKFGQEEGGNCYAVLRNHVKIIRGL